MQEEKTTTTKRELGTCAKCKMQISACTYTCICGYHTPTRAYICKNNALFNLHKVKGNGTISFIRFHATVRPGWPSAAASTAVAKTSTGHQKQRHQLLLHKRRKLAQCNQPLGWVHSPSRHPRPSSPATHWEKWVSTWSIQCADCKL